MVNYSMPRLPQSTATPPTLNPDIGIIRIIVHVHPGMPPKAAYEQTEDEDRRTGEDIPGGFKPRIAICAIVTEIPIKRFPKIIEHDNLQLLGL